MCKLKAIAAIFLAFALLFSTSCSANHAIDHQVNVATKSYRFSIPGWEFKTFFEKFRHIFSKNSTGTQNETDVINEYISLSNNIKSLKSQINDANRETLQNKINDLQKQQNDLTYTVEIIIKRQTTQILSDMGIYQPWHKYIKLKINFPPPDFKLETPPHLLVISPRDKIETINDYLLVEDLSTAEMEAIEAKVDQSDVSSLVVDLGGVGTYPSLVASDSDFRYILETCAHEWTHAYLTFTPLGFRYVMNIAGLSNNPDIVTMNETVADIVGKEVSAAIIAKYYPQLQTGNQTAAIKPSFDFNSEMRDIRKQVDQYLSAGEITTAEKFMQEKRDYLMANGYYIRKLNQAYFAFNGRYSDTPGFENPVGTKLNQLRTQSASLKDFLNTVSTMTKSQDLK